MTQFLPCNMSVHGVAANGFGQGNELYDRARPSYQPIAISHIREAVRSNPPLNVVEIGAGTGIFTRALLAHPEWKDAIQKLIAIEPSSGMREVFSKTVQDERVSVKEGTFDSTGVENGWADIIIIAQAFHWTPDHELACTEFSRILKPNGVLALIWNLEDRDAARWVSQVRNRIEVNILQTNIVQNPDSVIPTFQLHEAGSPQFRLGHWRKAFETTAYKNYFDPQNERVFEYSLETTSSQVVDRACSKSYMAILSPEDKQKAIKDLEAILERGEDKEWVDQANGIFKYPYQTFVVVCRRK
ncbi:hypothetical protein D9758_000584 [Tetrapyrgos nigripes]|uniref:Methyltransferase type 11 domain-containing protein n=1 Tax=Tetrapyrgos nigripes TaxID=182062 RepID=A0A8H5LY37_9AGAR|nr:hypothetical protein D9758_000584 [Tetrapyrgos nigripes]